jgi:hypothetical protein
MNPSRRAVLKHISGSIALLVAGRVLAREPVPEIPASKTEGGRPNPKALNPQPEVPSKGNPGGQTEPKALNPQPEVPSKPKKSRKVHGKMAPQPPHQP